MSPLSPRTKQLIRQALKEDIGSGDITTQALVSSKLKGEAIILAKQNGILAGSDTVLETFRALDKSLSVKSNVKDGKRIKKGQIMFRIRGKISSILKAERTALNFLSHLSGIATLTGQFVEQVKGTRAQIYDTRKTIPLWRELEKRAVKAGGGQNHRFGLWDQVLVKDNHWAALKNPKQLEVLCRRFQHKKYVEIEVADLNQLVWVLGFKPDAILLDNFTLSNLKKAVAIVSAFKKRPVLEVSGGVKRSNIGSIAKTGVNRISVGALTHSAFSLDFSLEMTKFHP